MYIYFILVGVSLLIIVSIIALTVFVLKNAMKKEPEKVPSVGEKTDWSHIKDFSDINANKSSKVNSFKDEFENEVNTVGAIFSDFSNMKNESAASFDKNVAQNDERARDDFKIANINAENDNISSKTNEEASNSDKVQNSTDEECEHNGTAYKNVTTKNVSIQDNIDNDATRSLDDIDYDATRSLDDVQLYEVFEKKIKVTLKYKDANGLKIQQMDTEQSTVGRGIGNDLLFRSDSFTSRNHAIFTIRDNELYIKDLNSKNGTFINKTKKVESEVKLEESCEITFGDVVVKVIIEK